MRKIIGALFIIAGLLLCVWVVFTGRVEAGDVSAPWSAIWLVLGLMLAGAGWGIITLKLRGRS